MDLPFYMRRLRECEPHECFTSFNQFDKLPSRGEGARYIENADSDYDFNNTATMREDVRQLWKSNAFSVDVDVGSIVIF